MSAEALNDARSGKAVVLLDYLQENYVAKHQFDSLHKVLDYSGIPKENVIFALNSFNPKEVYDRWYKPEEQKMEVWGVPYVMSNTSYTYNIASNVFQSGCMNVADLKQTYFTQRKNYFVFKIRRARTHRLAMLYKLQTNDLLQNADWSLLEPQPYDETFISNIAANYGFLVNMDKIKTIYQNLPKKLESESDSKYENVSAWTDKHFEPYQQSYFYLCTETYTDEGFESLTEKVFKPIANFQPFLFLAYPGALKLLRKLGFKTFHPFINEEYDNERDLNKRFNMIYDQIVRLTSMTKEEIHNWYWSMEEILIHNNHHIKNIHKNEPRAIEFIEHLYNKVNS
jgi:hypothetical protein